MMVGVPTATHTHAHNNVFVSKLYAVCFVKVNYAHTVCFLERARVKRESQLSLQEHNQ